jgi:hypothetical protein
LTSGPADAWLCRQRGRSPCPPRHPLRRLERTQPQRLTDGGRSSAPATHAYARICAARGLARVQIGVGRMFRARSTRRATLRRFLQPGKLAAASKMVSAWTEEGGRAILTRIYEFFFCSGAINNKRIAYSPSVAVSSFSTLAERRKLDPKI